MGFFSRFFLFGLMNILMLVTLGVLMFVLQNVFGVQLGGNSLTSLLLMSTVYGFFGSFMSLFLSKFMAKMSTGAQVIAEPRSQEEMWLVSTVRQHAERAGIGMPEVAVFPSNEVNAFATGWNRNHALVAVSAGLLHTMTRPEAEAVIGHEISHVANGDMVTMTLLQGVMNTFVIFFSRVVAGLVDAALSGRRDGERSRGGGVVYFIVSMILQVVLGLLAGIVLSWFSRRREYRADFGGAQLAGKGQMISALQRLQSIHEPATLPKSLSAFGIRGGGMMKLFSSHPPLEERIARLQTL